MPVLCVSSRIEVSSRIMAPRPAQRRRRRVFSLGSVASSSGHSPSSSCGTPGYFHEKAEPSLPTIPHRSLFLLPLPQRNCRRGRQVAESVSSCHVKTSTLPSEDTTLHNTLHDPLEPLSDPCVEADQEMLFFLEHQSQGDDCPGDLSASSAGAPKPCPCCNLPLGSCPEFIDCQIEIAYQVRKTGVPNQDDLRVPIQNRYLRPQAWADRLVNYWDVAPIMDGLLFGWDIGICGNPSPASATHNHPSAREFIDDVRNYIHVELQHGSIIGPLQRDALPFPVFVAPLGAVPKPHSARRRIITDLTFSGKGINNWIPKRWYRDQYWKISLPTIDDIVAAIKRSRERFPGVQSMGFKMDLSRYFRFLGVDPGQIPFLALLVDDQLFLDLVFSFGNRGAMVAAQRLSCLLYTSPSPRDS